MITASPKPPPLPPPQSSLNDDGDAMKLASTHKAIQIPASRALELTNASSTPPTPTLSTPHDLPPVLQDSTQSTAGEQVMPNLLANVPTPA